MIYRSELDTLRSLGYQFEEPWQVVDLFEKKVAHFFGASYGIATDCCTHALELSMRLLHCPDITVEIPAHTYMSVPMMLTKIDQPWRFCLEHWHGYYVLKPLPVIDAAFVWQRDSYVAGSLFCLSFQYKKHLAIGRGGMILTDNAEHYHRLQRLCRDGRHRELLQTQDDVCEIGYHYYMTPEDAARGIMLFDQLSELPTVTKCWKDYRILPSYSVFSNHSLS